MFAVIKTGGKQYKVTQGNILKIEKLAAETNEIIDFKEVFAVANNDKILIGSPLLDNTEVKARVLEHKRDSKVIVFKKKRRKGYDRKYGHRQHLSVIKIEDILTDGKSLFADKIEQNVKSATVTKETVNSPVKAADAKINDTKDNTTDKKSVKITSDKAKG